VEGAFIDVELGNIGTEESVEITAEPCGARIVTLVVATAVAVRIGRGVAATCTWAQRCRHIVCDWGGDCCEPAAIASGAGVAGTAGATTMDGALKPPAPPCAGYTVACAMVAVLLPHCEDIVLLSDATGMALSAAPGIAL